VKGGWRTLEGLTTPHHHHPKEENEKKSFSRSQPKLQKEILPFCQLLYSSPFALSKTKKEQQWPIMQQGKWKEQGDMSECWRRANWIGLVHRDKTQPNATSA